MKIWEYLSIATSYCAQYSFSSFCNQLIFIPSTSLRKFHSTHYKIRYPNYHGIFRCFWFFGFLLLDCSGASFLGNYACRFHHFHVFFSLFSKTFSNFLQNLFTDFFQIFFIQIFTEKTKNFSTELFSTEKRNEMRKTE